MSNFLYNRVLFLFSLILYTQAFASDSENTEKPEFLKQSSFERKKSSSLEHNDDEKMENLISAFPNLKVSKKVNLDQEKALISEKELSDNIISHLTLKPDINEQDSFTEVKNKQKKVYRKRLFLGEADFSYTVAFVKKHQEAHFDLAKAIIATELSSELELKEKYPDTFERNTEYLKKSGVDVLYGIDATKIHESFKDQVIPRIHFNFPHDGSNFKDQTLPVIIEGFFKSASQVQEKGDKIYMALPKPLDKEIFYQGYIYNLYISNVKGGYQLVKKRKFNSERYPGYKHCITTRNNSAAVAEAGREYIFKKVASTEQEKKDILKTSPPRKDQAYKKIIYALPFMETDNDSSDYEES